jgi:hypothetical protein
MSKENEKDSVRNSPNKVTSRDYFLPNFLDPEPENLSLSLEPSDLDFEAFNICDKKSVSSSSTHQSNLFIYF